MWFDLIVKCWNFFASVNTSIYTYTRNTTWWLEFFTLLEFGKRTKNDQLIIRTEMQPSFFIWCITWHFAEPICLCSRTSLTISTGVPRTRDLRCKCSRIKVHALHTNLVTNQASERSIAKDDGQTVARIVVSSHASAYAYTTQRLSLLTDRRSNLNDYPLIIGYVLTLAHTNTRTHSLSHLLSVC